MTPEGKVKARIKRLIKSFGPKVHAYWPVPYGYGSPTLDCIGCVAGVAFYIEAKAPGERPTARQQETIESIRAAGGMVFVIGEKLDPTTGEYSGMQALEEWLRKHWSP